MTETHKKMASSLNFSYITIQRNIEKIRQCEENGQPLSSIIQNKGRKNDDLSNKMIKLCEIVSDDPLLSQKGMGLKLESNNMTLSQYANSKNLKRMKITRKRFKKVYEKVTDTNIINQRRDYSIRYRNYPSEKLIYLDETGLNLHCLKNYASMSITVPVRSKNVSSLILISNASILHYNTVEGANNSTLFIEFFEECFRNGIVFEGRKLIMDNARIHKSEISLNYLNSKNVNFDFLPPYSPQLNPIEEFFCSLKARYHSIRPIARTNQELIRNLTEIFDDISNGEYNFNGFYNHMKEYLDKAFNREFF